MLNKLIGTNKTEHITPNKLIINNDEINNPQTVAETFNNYFANRGKEMGAVIKTEDWKCSKVLSRNYSNSIYFDESSPSEVELIINELSQEWANFLAPWPRLKIEFVCGPH